MPRLNQLCLALLCAGSVCSLSAADVHIRLAPGETLRKRFGSTEFEIVHTKRTLDQGEQLPSATFAFDKDVRIAGNELPAGEYDVALEVAAEEDVHVVFCSGGEELLRYAVRPERCNKATTSAIDLELKEPEPPGEGRRRRHRREPSAEIHFQWSGRSATLPMQMTGVLWRSTPEPDMPAAIREPWAIVKSSLMGLVHQSMNEHVEHFADDFESDWDDGGSQKAHTQMIGRMLFEGEFEDAVLKLDQLKWDHADGRVVFRGMVVQAPLGPSPLVYTVEETDNGWKIIHLDGPKQD